MIEIGAACRPRLARGVRLRVDHISGKTLLLRPEQGFELQGSALEIVKLCTAEPTVAEIVDRLVASHEGVRRDEVEADVARLLSDLVARGLIVVGDAETATSANSEMSITSATSEPAASAQASETSVAIGAVPRPYTLVAELTYRCPLRCAYCSNPVQLNAMGPDLETDIWSRVFQEAARLGVMQVTLTGGEPLLRPDLEQLVAAAHASGLYTTLITSGIPLDRDRLTRLRDAGLDGVQLSFQDSDAAAATRIAGMDALPEKVEVAGWIRGLG
ncbi:MAG: pyrroloquinoline quinone biosynthesis peptide chaperone PqqD, partial [Deltaproteobacteria bacterium]|nr:pyrroloquinoline quinone biosynthesis peptide chaperone PqqD [Deltaproteobacteria bacterium]